MNLLEAKKSLYSVGYCDFDLNDFNEEFYKLFETIKYKTDDVKYLDNFTCVRFDYHNEKTDEHHQLRDFFETFEEADVRKKEIIKTYSYEESAQLWLQSNHTPYSSTDEFKNVFYKILEYFYGKTEETINCGMQWTCYSEDCFLKDHNDGQGDEYQNTCAILIYLNEEWNEEWGGNLILRNTKNVNDRNKATQYKVIPEFGKVAVIDLATFDTAHAVETIIGDHKRCTLLAFATDREKRKPKIV